MDTPRLVMDDAAVAMLGTTTGMTGPEYLKQINERGARLSDVRRLFHACAQTDRPGYTVDQARDATDELGPLAAAQLIANTLLASPLFLKAD